MLRLAFDFIIAWREIRARPNAYHSCTVFTTEDTEDTEVNLFYDLRL